MMISEVRRMNEKNNMDLAISASEELLERRKMQKADLIKIGTMTVLGVIVFIFASIAWFSMNKETTANSMTIKTTTMPFDIATTGAQIRNESLINERNPEYISGTSDILSDNKGGSHTFFSGDSLLLRYDTGDSEIGPGGRGELSLYVIPKSNDAMSVRVSLNVVAFAEITKKDEEGNTIYKLDGSGNATDTEDTEIIEITNATDFASKARASGVNNNTAADDADEYVEAAEYLKGHILFFGDEGDISDGTAEASRYYYSKPYTQRTFSSLIEADQKDIAVQIPLYWMWTNTLSQIALADNKSNQRSGYPILQDSNDSGKALIKQYLKTNKECIFTNSSGAVTDGYIDVVTASYASESAFNAAAGTAFTNLSDGYNQADFAIGTRISYFMIEVTVEPDN